MRVLAVTGASGGHIFPALSFLDALKDKYKDIDTLLIVPKKSLEARLIPSNYKVYYISISTIRLGLNFKNFSAILNLFKGSLQSLSILLEFRPDIVIGFGSLVSVPLILLAWIFRMKTLIHEQNVILGRANRLLARFADKIAVSFSESRNYLIDYSAKITLTGNPLRRQLKKMDKNTALGFFGLDSGKFTILVMGGSLGSHRINLAFLKAISLISEKSRIQIIHLSGFADYELLKENYKDLDAQVKLLGFLNQMQYAYSACDLVIARAGATSITEIIFFELPAIIIPYPFAYAHQLTNACVLEGRGCAKVIKDNDLDSAILREGIEELVNNPDAVKKMRSNYDSILKLNAEDLLVNAVATLN